MAPAKAPAGARAASLTYNVLTLSAELRDVSVAAADTPDEPLGAAASIGVGFGGGALLFRPDVRQLSLTSPRVAIRESPDGSDNLPSIGGDPGK